MLFRSPEDWDYTLQGLARINRESIDATRQAIRELEQAGYIQRSRERDEKGRLRGADYVIFELPQPVPASVSPTLENPTLENPTQENPTLENPMQLNKDLCLISEIIEKWIKGILIDGITGNLSGLFDNVNAKVGEIASDVGSIFVISTFVTNRIDNSLRFTCTNKGWNVVVVIFT